MAIDTSSATELGLGSPEIWRPTPTERTRAWDPQLNQLDRIDPSVFIEGRSDRYKLVRHTELLIAIQDELDSKRMGWERRRICTTEQGAVMVAQYELHDFYPHAVAFVRNSYNGKYAVSIAVGMVTKAGVRLLGDYQPLYKKHTSGLDIVNAVRAAVMDIPRQYNDGVNTYITPMGDTLVGHAGIPTAKDILWRLYVEEARFPISALAKVYAVILEVGLRGNVSLLDVHDAMLATVRFDKSLDGAVKRAHDITVHLSTHIDRMRFPLAAA
jgi:hypothetical protein